MRTEAVGNECVEVAVLGGPQVVSQKKEGTDDAEGVVVDNDECCFCRCLRGLLALRRPS
jgi:hypothetical protein